MGKYAEAVEAFAYSQELAGNREYAAALRDVSAKKGMKGLLQYVTDERTRVCIPRKCTPYTLAANFAQLGEKDKAFAELEKAYEERNYAFFAIKEDPRFDPLRDDPRFNELLKKIGLAP
jgi:hypothetical protein